MTALASNGAARHGLARVLVVLSVAAGLAMTALLLAEGRWLPALLGATATLAAALAPLLRLPRALVALVAVASVVNGASIAWDWYTAWTHFDDWAHFVNLAVLVAPSMTWLHRARLVTSPPGGPLFVAAAVVLGLVLGVGWEVIESYIWVFPLSDTLSDVALGLLGSALGAWWAGRLIGPGDGAR